MSGGARGATGLAQAYGRHRYGVLFYLLLIALAGGPLLAAFRFSADGLQLLLAFSLLAALVGIPGQRWRLVLMLVAAVAVALRLAPPSAVGTGVATGATVATSGIALFAAASAIRFAMRTRVVDAEHVYAALSAYLLAGLFFGVLYSAIESAWPGSFAGAGGSTAGLPLDTAIYYSFVTLATLGFGDIVPKSDLSRGVTILEAVGGQLYIAVMIARLVGARLQRDDRAG